MSKIECKCEIYINGRFLARKVSGVERFSIEITKELLKLDPRIKVIAPQKAKPQKELNHSDVVYKGIFSGHFWEQIILPFFLKRKSKALLLNFANTSPLFCKQKITTLHDIAFKDHPEWFSEKFSVYYNFLIPRLLKTSKHIFTVSEFSKKRIHEQFTIPPDKISVIYNGVSSVFTKSNPNKKPFDFNYYLTVGTLQPRKNLKRLMEAYHQIPHPKNKLVIVGNINTIFEDDNNELKPDQDVIIKENVNDTELCALYKYAEKFIYPSLYEGFGLPVLEAIYFSCPVVASNIHVFRELFGDTIGYFNPYDIQSIKEGIEKKPYFSENSELIKQIKKYNFATSAKQILGIIEDKKDSICA